MNTKNLKKKGIKKPVKALPSDQYPLVSPKEEPKELITPDTIIKYMEAFGLAAQLTENEKIQFIEVARQFQLNPFKREIYCVPYENNVKLPDGSWGKKRALSIITGYEVYLKRADRLHVLSGWNAKTEGTGNSMKAVCTIYRKDWQHPFIHEVLLTEYIQYRADGKPTKFWAEKPATMLKKVVTAQSFRLCFPDEFGGMPYTSDELPPAMTEPLKIETTDAPAESHQTAPDEPGGVQSEPAYIPPTEKKTNKNCPICGEPAIIKGKAEYGGGFLCWKKAKVPGCGAKFDDNMVQKTDTPKPQGNGKTKDEALAFFDKLPERVQEYLAPLSDKEKYEFCKANGWSNELILAAIERETGGIKPIQELFD